MTSPPSRVLTVGAVRVHLPALDVLVGNCCEIEREAARRIVEDHGDVLMLAIELGIVQLLARHGLLAQHVAQS
jgi:hypothetical protein